MSKQIQFDRLDTILALATAEYMRQETEAFLAAETDATLGEETKRKITRMIRMEKGKNTRRKVWKVLHTLLIAALAAATVALVACVAHPEIRDAIWKVVLTWGDESVQIEFVPATPNRKPGADSAPTDSPTQKPNAPDDPIPDPPKSIEELRMPGFVPEKWTFETQKSRSIFTVDYFNGEGKVQATFQQMTMGYNSSVNSEGAVETKLTVNGWEAVLLTYAGKPDLYVLYWQDASYRYSLNGAFESLDQLLRMAQSVYGSPHELSDTPPDVLHCVKLPKYCPTAFAKLWGKNIGRMFQLVLYDTKDNYSGTFTQTIIKANSFADAEGAIATEVVINGFDGVVLTYANEPGVYAVYWQDHEYRYHIYALFDSMEDALRMAESVDVR